jgi:hypothetical protein
MVVSEICIVVYGTSVRHLNLAQIICVFYILIYRVRKNSMPKIRDLVGGDQNKDLLSRNCMSEMSSCNATGRQIGSDWGWKSSKTTEVFWKQKLYFVPIYSICSNVQPPTSINSRQRSRRDWRELSKMPGCCLMVAASTIRAMRSSSESTSHSHLQRWRDWTGRANSLASQVTGPRTNGLFPMGPRWSPDLHVASWLQVITITINSKNYWR